MVCLWFVVVHVHVEISKKCFEVHFWAVRCPKTFFCCCWALQNLSVALCIEVAFPLLWLDYTVTRGMGTSGNVDYHCWPSYSQQGCVLSVHSAREAAYICNSHSQCNSFTLTGQTTWTGSLKHRYTPPFFSSVRNVMFFCCICFTAHFSLNKSYHIN